MRRRDFITALWLAAAPELVLAPQVLPGYRITLLGPNVSSEMTEAAQYAPWPAFFDELRRLGYVEGSNLIVDRISLVGGRTREDYDELAYEAVHRNPNLIVSVTTPGTLALQKQTRTIPIIFLTLTDPASTGLVSSETKPGANITGFTDYEYSVAGKWVELLKEISHATTRIVMPFDEVTAPFAAKFIRPAESAATRLSMSLSAYHVGNVSEFDRTIEAFATASGGGLVVLPYALAYINLEHITELARQHHLPAMYPWPEGPRQGGLASYNFDHAKLFRDGAGYVHRILHGAKPADLPVQSPSKFDLVLNLKTARDLGLTIPPSLLARADEVIE